MFGVGSEPGEAKASENSKLGVVGLCGEEFVEWCLHVNDRCGQPIDQIRGRSECICPVGFWHVRMSEQRHASFNNMSVLSLGDSIVFWGVWWCGEVGDAGFS